MLRKHCRELRMKLHFIKKRKLCCSTFYGLFRKYCSEFGNELLSKRVAATRCPVAANLELQFNSTLSQTSSNIIDISSSMHWSLIYSTGIIMKDIWDFSLTLLIDTTKFLKYVWMKVELIWRFAAGHPENLHVASTGQKTSDIVWSSYPQSKGEDLKKKEKALSFFQVFVILLQHSFKSSFAQKQ